MEKKASSRSEVESAHVGAGTQQWARGAGGPCCRGWRGWTVVGVAGSCGLVPWGGGGLGREVGEGAARSPWAPRSVRSGRRGAGGCAPGWERPGLGGGLGEKRLPSFAQGVPVGARARTCVHCGGQGAGRSPWCAAACARRGPPPPASRERRWAGDIHLYPHPGRCSICLATVPGCCAQEGRGLVPWRTSRGTGPWCARPSTWRAAGARTRQERRYSTRFHSDRGCQYTSAQLARHLKGYGTRPSVSRTGVRWAGAWAEAGGRRLQGTRGPIRWSTTARSKTIRDTAPPFRPSPEQARNTQSETAPPRPEGTGHPARPTRSTEQQDKQPETPPSELSETRPAAQ